MPIRTKEQLKAWFAIEKQKRLQQQEQQKAKQKQIKAQEQLRKRKHKQHQAKLEKEAQKAQEQPQIEFSRTIHIYNVKYIERFADDEDLYQSREELEQAMPNNINWRLWDKLIQKTKQMLNNDKGREKRVQ